MRVTMRTIYAGPNGQAGPGQEIELPRAEALALVAGGYAKAEGPLAVETAVVVQPETADIKRARPRKEKP